MSTVGLGSVLLAKIEKVLKLTQRNSQFHRRRKETA